MFLLAPISAKQPVVSRLLLVFVLRGFQKLQKTRVSIGLWGKVVREKGCIHLGNFIGTGFVLRHADDKQANQKRGHRHCRHQRTPPVSAFATPSTATTHGGGMASAQHHRLGNHGANGYGDRAFALVESLHACGAQSFRNVVRQITGTFIKPGNQSKSKTVCG